MSAAAPDRALHAGARTGARVLLVEDEPGLLRALVINLRARQYDVITASSGREALATAASRPPDAVILDLGLPDIDGTEVIVELRRWSKAPIIVLSGRASPGDKIGALDVGADDYVTKPFSMAELLARLRAVLRRDEGAPPGDSAVTVGHCIVDLTAHTVTRKKNSDDTGEPVRLTPTEWRILEGLARRPGQLVSARQLSGKQTRARDDPKELSDADAERVEPVPVEHVLVLAAHRIAKPHGKPESRD